MINVANQAMSSGNYDKAIAYTDLVLVHDEVRYAINLSLIPDYQRETAKVAAHKAINLWQEALGSEVKFTEVDPSQATVRINFEPSVRSMGSEVAGYAVWQRQVYDWGNGNFSRTLTGDIRLRTQTPTGREMPEGAMVHTAAHELGHMLGLWDSPNFGDVMGPLYLKQPVTKLSDNEVSALREARAQALEISQACLLAKRK
jgi:predicted Zn-dependent protease